MKKHYTKTILLFVFSLFVSCFLVNFSFVVCFRVCLLCFDVVARLLCYVYSYLFLAQFMMNDCLLHVISLMCSYVFHECYA